jgi:preprotein translocase subunit SecA
MMVGDIKTFLHEEVRKAYDLKEAQVDQIQPGLMRQAERFFILQQIDTLWREHLQRWMHCGSPLVCAATVKKTP